MSLFAELKRRNVHRAAAAYVAVSWLLIQMVEMLFPVFRFPKNGGQGPNRTADTRIFRKRVARCCYLEESNINQ